MVDTDSLTWFRAVQRVAADVSGMEIVHGVTPPASGAASSPLLRPATYELFQVPAIVIGYGGAEIVPGSWERQTHTLSAAIWRSNDPLSGLDLVYDALVADVGRVINAFPPRGKAYGVSVELQSVLVVSIGAIDGFEWPRDSDRWYLVLPFELEVIVNRAAAYVAA